MCCQCKECRTTAPRTKAPICNKPNALDKEEESDESEQQESEEDGEMACTGGCKGKWSRYRFNDQNWNDDPLAGDGMWHEYCTLSYHHLCILTAHGCALTTGWCCQVLFSVFNVTSGCTTLVWGGQLYKTKTNWQIGPAGSVHMNCIWHSTADLAVVVAA